MLVSSDSITLLELSVVTNTKHHFLAVSHGKQDRYGPLLKDLKCTSLSVELVTVEVGCLGHFVPVTVAKLSEVFHQSKYSIRGILQQAAKVAISCLYRIFNARSSTSWYVIDLLD